MKIKIDETIKRDSLFVVSIGIFISKNLCIFSKLLFATFAVSSALRVLLDPFHHCSDSGENMRRSPTFFRAFAYNSNQCEPENTCKI